MCSNIRHKFETKSRAVIRKLLGTVPHKHAQLTVGFGAVDSEEVVVSQQQAIAVLAARPLTDRLAVHTRPEITRHDVTVTSYTHRGTCESISQPRVLS